MGHCLVTKNRIVYLQKLNWRTSCYTTEDQYGKSSTVCVCFLYVKTKKGNLNVELFNRSWKGCLCRGGKEVGFDQYISYIWMERSQWIPFIYTITICDSSVIWQGLKVERVYNPLRNTKKILQVIYLGCISGYIWAYIDQTQYIM